MFLRDLFVSSTDHSTRCLALALVFWFSVTAGIKPSLAETPVSAVEDGGGGAVAMPAACTGYWMVSTNGLPQSFDGETLRFCPRVTRVPRGCRPRTASFPELCRSLIPGVPVCIYVHGSFVGPREVQSQSRQTNHWLRSASRGEPMQMINFAWPSSRPILIPTIKLDVNLLGRRAARNGWYLAELICCIPSDCPVCLIGHSHGSRVVASALHLIGGGAVQGVTHRRARATGRLIRTVFAASAIRHDWLNPDERYGRALCAASCVLNLRNTHDHALMLYPLRHPFSGHSLGTTGFTRRDRKSLRGWSPKVQDHDVTQLIGFGHMWPRYVQQQRLAWLIRNFVYFPDVQQGRRVSAVAPTGLERHEDYQLESVDQPG